MADNLLRNNIEQALHAFAKDKGQLRPCTLALLDTLGYRSERTLPQSSFTPDTFVQGFDRTNKLSDKSREALAVCQQIEFLFQLTDAEIADSDQPQISFTENRRWNSGIYQSFVFLAAQLDAANYTRTDLAALTRVLNAPFNMPVPVIFRYGEFVTLAIIHRRPNKRDDELDVLEKVTLIKDIRAGNPHAAHLRMLEELALKSLRVTQTINSFDALQRAWAAALDISTLNKRFYQDLANWYFWAVDEMRFPDDAPKDADGSDSISVIRLLTRLIFVWFVKEKQLIPSELFDEPHLKTLLKFGQPQDTTYYKAILQNLFFATLNTEMGQRGWAREGQNMMAHTLYRYRDMMAKPEAVFKLLAGIPFLNGGLFECLDKDLGEGRNPRYIRVDGFSRRPDNSLQVPDLLFFGEERDIDLNADYGTTKKRYKTRGILHIFNSYKFTIEENTPIDEEVALDPELLGKVFENLLAAYNPETGTTARKQTGSFYTPREIVDYMVDESLLAYLLPVAEASSLSGPMRLEASATATEYGFFSPDEPIGHVAGNLPHWRQEGKTYFVTFRLADSMPQEKLEQWIEERDAWLKAHPEPRAAHLGVEYRRLFSERFEQWLDAGYGACTLAKPDIKELVEKALRFFDGTRYTLGEFVVAINHVHAVVTPLAGYPLSDILHSWKSFTANQANALLNRKGEIFWQKESYDHIVRGPAQLERIQQ